MPSLLNINKEIITIKSLLQAVTPCEGLFLYDLGSRLEETRARPCLTYSALPAIKLHLLTE